MTQMTHLLVVFLCLFGAALSLTTFKAQFTVTALVFNNGYFTGTVTYDFNKRVFNLQFPLTGLYSELYSFNSKGGFDPAFGNGQYFGQVLYRTSLSCPCETSILNFYQPPLFTDVAPGNTYWSKSGPASNINGQSCDHYVPTSTYLANSLVTEYWQSANGDPCQFTLSDGRIFTLSNVASTVSGTDAQVFTPPTGCKCGKPIDIVVSLDRSGSINHDEFSVEKQFTYNLTQKFDFGPLKANMGILNWKKDRWAQIPLIEGNSIDKVNAAINAMGCTDGATTGTSSCTCCGTPIGGALYDATREMLTSSRQSTKMVILLTDGCQNHYFTPPDTGAASATQCSCTGGEQSCQTNPDCKNDLEKWSKYLLTSVPGVKVITIGVGSDTEICPQQLLLANDVIAAQACTLSDSPCTGSCCGICSCGNCLSPEGCKAPDNCTDSSIDVTVSKCCTTKPKVCPPKKCNDVVCDRKLGCNYIPTKCENQDPTNCTYPVCDAVTGSCTQVKNTSKTCNVQPICNDTKKCSNNRKCYDNVCVNGSCVQSPRNCGVSDKCADRYCDPGTDKCVTITKKCDDGSKCTTDTCNPATGCVFTTINCPLSTNKCLIPKCAKDIGCYNDTMDCSNFTIAANKNSKNNKTNCTFYSCKNGTCRNFTVCLVPPPFTPERIEVVVGAALGTAALVGIIIAAVVAVAALAGGGAYAIAGGGGAGLGPQIGNNPLYAGAGANAQNPLYKAA